MPTRRIPSLNWLRVFEAAARTESFAKAAQRLNMSAAAVSQQIKALEQFLGRDLFARGAHSVSLTDAGRVLLPTVHQALQSVEVRLASLASDRASETLTVQAALVLACSWLAERLSDFQRRHPNVRVHLLEEGRSLDFTRADVDMMILLGEDRIAWGDSDRLYSETVYPVAAPAIAARIATAEDLLDEQLIEISSHRLGWVQLLESAGVQDVARLRHCFSDTTQIALSLAAVGYGVALARAPTTNLLVSLYGLQPCLPGLILPESHSYYLTYRSRGALSPAAARFREWLLEMAADPGARPPGGAEAYAPSPRKPVATR